MYRIVVNVETGEQETVQLTAAEIAEVKARPQLEPTPALVTKQELEAIDLNEPLAQI